jgi:hypothetical protein
MLCGGGVDGVGGGHDGGGEPGDPVAAGDFVGQEQHCAADEDDEQAQGDAEQSCVEDCGEVEGQAEGERTGPPPRGRGPPAAGAEALNAQNTWEIERTRYSEEVPMAFMRTWVPPGLFPYLAQGLLEDASLLALMREHGYHPAGGPRQVQAVTADPGLSQKLNTSPRQPLLLLEGVTREALGYGPEWFNVWHAPNTVFDVDAQLTSQPASISQEHLRRLRTLIQQLETELAALDQTARWPPLGQMGPRGDFVGRASRRSCQDALTRAVRAVTLTLWPGTAAAPSPTEPSPDQATLLPNDRPGVAAGAAALRPGDSAGV